jgi:heme/copper-type cytochrome/quinol oxidase subunit 2
MAESRHERRASFTRVITWTIVAVALAASLAWNAVQQVQLGRLDDREAATREAVQQARREVERSEKDWLFGYQRLLSIVHNLGCQHGVTADGEPFHQIGEFVRDCEEEGPSRIP